MNEDKFKKISKSLSYWLRHHPEDIGIVISSDGWTDIKDLLEKAKLKLFFDFNDLKYVVQNNDKKRFSLSEDMCSIRANQGHSAVVEMNFKEVEPLNKIEWGEFFIEEIAQIISGRDIYETERKKGNIPYVSATANNNGIGYFVGNSNETLEENCLSVNRNGSVGYSFYHQYKALFSNDCRKLRLENKSPFVGKFISRIITGQKDKYGYGYKMGTGRIKRQKILLPIDKKGLPDYDYMENYIKKLEHEKLTKYLTRKTTNA
jgi:hypothetical protein